MDFLQAKIGGKLSSVAYVEEIEVEDVDAAMLGKATPSGQVRMPYVEKLKRK